MWCVRKNHKKVAVFVLIIMLLVSFSTFATAAEPAVSGGARFSLALKGDGTVWAWGQGGALGDETSSFEYQTSLVQVKSDLWTDFTGVAAVEAGDIFSVAVKEDGTVWTWGGYGLGRLGQGQFVRSTYPGKVEGVSDIVAVSANSHTLALKADGTVWAWGYGGQGRIGDGEQETRSEPVQVQGLTGVTAVAAGNTHSVALKEDGTVWAWGDNLFQTLGIDQRGDVLTPTQVPGLSNITAIDAGNRFTMALKEDGTVMAWGHGLWNWLGTAGRDKPVPVPNLSNVKAISAGDNHCLFLKEDDTVWVWGGPNDEGQLGTGTVEDKEPVRDQGEVRPPRQVQGLSNVIAIEGGGGYGEVFSMAMVQEDEEQIILRIGQPSARIGGVSLYAWGENDYGQLGDGTTELRTSPVKVPIDLTPAMALDVPPEIVNGRTVVPLRFIGEQLGASFEWDGETRQITYTKDDTTILLWIGQNRAVVNGEELTLDVPPEIINGRTVVPLRFIGEQLGASFEWEGTTQTITITP